MTDLPWMIITGDNGTGKTVLLKCIALGLCDEPSAAALLRESDSGYIRRGAPKGSIALTIEEGNLSHTITTTIEQINYNGYSYERLRQHVKPDFPWHKIFLCGYGASRGVSGSGDLSGYSVINSVYNMFNYTEGLQNPELIIRRLNRDIDQRNILSSLQELLPLGSKDQIKLNKGGIFMDGPWGPNMPFRDIADGYRSSFLWIMDMIGWAFAKDQQLRNLSDIQGIILIDELEQHLHPSWQRDILEKLRNAFPRIQFIVTTHSPLIAGAANSSKLSTFDDLLIHLSYDFASKSVQSRSLDLMTGYRADQILASPIFDRITDNPELERVLNEASRLAEKGDQRVKEENARYDHLKTALREILLPEGQTMIERTLESERYAEIRSRIRELEKELFEN